MKRIQGGNINYENDISTEKKSTFQSSRFQSQNEHKRRKEGPCSKKIKGKKSIICLIIPDRPQFCGLFITDKYEIFRKS